MTLGRRIIKNDGKTDETTILLVEDHEAFREALAFVLEREPGLTVVGEAASLSGARELLRGSRKADVAIIDLMLPDGEGTELIRQFSASNPRTATLVLSASLDPEPFARAAAAGADGLLHKAEAVRDIADAVRRLKAGEFVLSPQRISEVLRVVRQMRHEEDEARRAVQKLTPREKQILQAFANGLDSKDVAKELGIAIETERTHVMNILKKLNVHSRLQALVFAVRQGIVEIR